MVFKLKPDSGFNIEFIQNFIERRSFRSGYGLYSEIMPGEQITDWFSEDELTLIQAQPDWRPENLTGGCSWNIEYNPKSGEFKEFQISFAFGEVEIDLGSVAEDVLTTIKDNAVRYVEGLGGIYEIYISITSNNMDACKLIETREFESQNEAEFYAYDTAMSMYLENPVKRREELAEELKGMECPFECDTQQDYDEFFTYTVNNKFWEHAEMYLCYYIKKVGDGWRKPSDPIIPRF